MISLKIGFLLLLLTVIQVQQMRSYPCDRTCIGVLNATVQTHSEGCAKDDCNEKSIKCVKRMKGCHELNRKIVMDSDWESYAAKCTEIIENFFFTVKKLLNVYEEQCGIFNFNANASVEKECPRKTVPKTATTKKKCTNKVCASCRKKGKGSRVKATKPKACSSLRKPQCDFDSRKLTKDSKKSKQSCEKKESNDGKSSQIKDERDLSDKKLKSQKENLPENKKPDEEKDGELKIEGPTSKKPSGVSEEPKLSKEDSRDEKSYSCDEQKTCERKEMEKSKTKESSNDDGNQKPHEEVKKLENVDSTGDLDSAEGKKFKNNETQSNGHPKIVEEQDTNGGSDGTVMDAEKDDEKNLKEIQESSMFNDTVPEPVTSKSNSNEETKPKTKSSSEVVKPVVTETKDFPDEKNVGQKTPEESVDAEKSDCEKTICKKLKEDGSGSSKEDETSSANKTEKDQNNVEEDSLHAHQRVSTVRPEESPVLSEEEAKGDVSDEEKNESGKDEDKKKCEEESNGECGQKTSVDEEKDKHLDEPLTTKQPTTTTTSSDSTDPYEPENYYDDYDYGDYKLPKTTKKGFQFIRITTAFPSVQK